MEKRVRRVRVRVDKRGEEAIGMERKVKVKWGNRNR